MRSLEEAVVLIEGWGRARSKDRELVLSCLDTLAVTCDEASEVWQRYLENPGAAGNHWTLVSWIGPERAKRLHEINLRAGEQMHQLCTIVGPEVARFCAYEDSMIEMAYRQLGPGETGPDRARSAVEHMNTHHIYLNSVSERVKSIRLADTKSSKRASGTGLSAKKPPAGTAKKTAVAAAKKPVKKKVTRATKKAAKPTKATKANKKKAARQSMKHARRPTARRK